MINSKAELKEYMKKDMKFYSSQSRKERIMCYLTKDPIWYIAKYIRFLRKEEYYYNTGKNKWKTLAYLYYLSRKNSLGNKLGFKIPKNCFGPGLTIYHHGEIIVNEKSRVGANCILHGGNCIGNNGKQDEVPIIGEGFDLGIGAKVIGPVKIGNNVKVGANAVVTRSYEMDEVTLVGIPAYSYRKADN